MDNLTIRRMAPWDIPKTLQLMKRRADFKDHSDTFKIKELDLLYRSQGDEPQFHCFVAIGGDSSVIGYAIITLTHFTCDLVPTANFKEIYVDTNFQGIGVGSQLLNAVVKECQANGITRLNWTVNQDNDKEEHFYQKKLGQPSKKGVFFEYIIKNKT